MLSAEIFCWFSGRIISSRYHKRDFLVTSREIESTFSGSNIGTYNDLALLPVLSTKLYSPASHLSSIHFSSGSLSYRT